MMYRSTKKKIYVDPTRESKTGVKPINTILVGKRCLHTSFELFYIIVIIFMKKRTRDIPRNSVLTEKI